MNIRFVFFLAVTSLCMWIACARVRAEDEPAPAPIVGAPPVQNFGLDPNKLSGKTSYRINGVETTKDRVIEAIERGAPDFPRARAYVTVIGTLAEQQTARTVVPELATGVALHYYRPGQEMVRSHKQTGHPTVYVQDDKGKVLYKADDTKNLPEKLARLGLTKDSPTPQPEPDPQPDPQPKPDDPDKPCPCPCPCTPTSWWIWLLLGFFAGVAFLLVIEAYHDRCCDKKEELQ